MIIHRLDNMMTGLRDRDWAERIVRSIIEIFLSDPALSCIVNIVCYSVREYVVIEESE